MDCEIADFLLWPGLGLIVLGLTGFPMSLCGYYMCCCFGKNAAPAGAAAADGPATIQAIQLDGVGVEPVNLVHSDGQTLNDLEHRETPLFLRNLVLQLSSVPQARFVDSTLESTLGLDDATSPNSLSPNDPSTPTSTVDQALNPQALRVVDIMATDV
jgi:hypothetical protein